MADKEFSVQETELLLFIASAHIIPIQVSSESATGRNRSSLCYVSSALQPKWNKSQSKPHLVIAMFLFRKSQVQGNKDDIYKHLHQNQLYSKPWPEASWSRIADLRTPDASLTLGQPPLHSPEHGLISSTLSSTAPTHLAGLGHSPISFSGELIKLIYRQICHYSSAPRGKLLRRKRVQKFILSLKWWEWSTHFPLHSPGEARSSVKEAEDKTPGLGTFSFSLLQPYKSISSKYSIGLKELHSPTYYICSLFTYHYH